MPRRRPTGKAKGQMIKQVISEDLIGKINDQFGARIEEAVGTPMKGERNEALDALRDEAKVAIKEEYGDSSSEAGLVGTIIEKLAKKYTRKMILGEGKRPDGRKAGELRNLEAAVSILPRVHGTGLFQRGETQVLTIATLGSPGDGKIVDSLLEGEEIKRYLHHYNFPPYSAKPSRCAGRADAKSVTARSPKKPSFRFFRRSTIFRMCCVWYPKYSRPTARLQWRACAGVLWP